MGLVRPIVALHLPSATRFPNTRSPPPSPHSPSFQALRSRTYREPTAAHPHRASRPTDASRRPSTLPPAPLGPLLPLAAKPPRRTSANHSTVTPAPLRPPPRGSSSRTSRSSSVQFRPRGPSGAPGEARLGCPPARATLCMCPRARRARCPPRKDIDEGAAFTDSRGEKS